MFEAEDQRAQNGVEIVHNVLEFTLAIARRRRKAPYRAGGPGVSFLSDPTRIRLIDYAHFISLLQPRTIYSSLFFNFGRLSPQCSIHVPYNSAFSVIRSVEARGESTGFAYAVLPALRRNAKAEISIDTIFPILKTCVFLFQFRISVTETS